MSSINNPTAPLSTSINGTITANAQTVILPCAGYGTVSVMVFGVYGSVNIRFDVSFDNGTTYETSFQMVRNAGATIEATSGILSNTTRSWTGNVGAATHFRVTATAYTSGTQNVYISAVPAGSDRFTTVQGNITTVATVTTVSTLTSITNAVTVTGSVTVSGTVTMASNCGATSSGATNLVKGICSLNASSGDLVVGMGVARKNSPANICGADGQYSIAINDGFGRLYTKDRSSPTGTCTNVADSATNVTLLALNTSRTHASFHNDSTSVLYLKCAATATATSYTKKMAAAEHWELPICYTGIIDGIWATAPGGAVRITEYT